MIDHLLPLLLIMFGGSPPPVAVPATRWSFEGHRLICEIAWRELTPLVRERVQSLMAADPAYAGFPESCAWADEVRRDPAYGRYTTAHYVNLPRNAVGVDVARDCADTYCVIEAIRDMMALLRDGGAPTRQRLEALKFLGHFVGDIHQPLHAGYGEDRGGNDTPVQFDGRDINLHWLWDGVLLEQLGFRPSDAARLHAEINPIDRTLWGEIAPERWAEESFQLVEREVYHGVRDGRLATSYVERNRYTVKRQILKAGVRLGAILNQVLGG
jgi:hypothetical protein